MDWITSNEQMLKMRHHDDKEHLRGRGVAVSSEAVTCCAFSPDGVHAATGSDGNTVRRGVHATVAVVNSLTGELVWQIEHHTDKVESVCFSLCGKQVASGSQDATVREKVQESTRKYNERNESLAACRRVYTAAAVLCTRTGSYYKLLSSNPTCFTYVSQPDMLSSSLLGRCSLYIV